ncbi:uncharacterized protein LOC104898604 [Beta vulgaris subsp. vulgaris]|uniref:uncharacterized protein LOC104898604 n=1 Tax=Beta vulgaris subsp. vulgaris TaxID=3555 RepID=UPI0020367F6F|nr:uncharacterized protein LOC104898604 [Beta vulgaris subsp. vulgaris]
MTCVTSTSCSLMINGNLFGFFKPMRGLRQGDPISPLLFVICMEYMTRIMKHVGLKKDFKFHPRCKSIQLNHLVFADDVLLFCKGEFVSTYMMLQGFKLFSEKSGLCVNKSKTAVYTAGMENDEINRILNVSGFSLGKLPFTYLGMHIFSTRISNGACQTLCDKMISRIKTWSSRNLSYAARVQLINSVLMSLHVYWGQIIVIPKGVIRKIMEVCRSFLWRGEYFTSRPGNIEWNQICLPKKAGGLGFRRIDYWNQTALGKLVWAIAKKEDSLWIKWINTVYIKDAGWWDYKPPKNASWYWKCICEVKEKLKNNITIPVIMQVQKYQIKNVYTLMMGESPRCFWDKWVWCRQAVPKFNFVCWLAIQNRLYTRDRLVKWGAVDDDKYPICQNVEESHHHLWFQCTFSKRVLQEILGWFNIRWMNK